MLARLIDFLKANQITMVATSLTSGGDSEEQSEVGISSLMDSWLLVRNLETNGERNRGLYILKSRGMAHSNQVREFVLSGEGIQLVDVYTGQGTLLTGSARLAQWRGSATTRPCINRSSSKAGRDRGPDQRAANAGTGRTGRVEAPHAGIGIAWTPDRRSPV